MAKRSKTPLRVLLKVFAPFWVKSSLSSLIRPLRSMFLVTLFFMFFNAVCDYLLCPPAGNKRTLHLFGLKVKDFFENFHLFFHYLTGNLIGRVEQNLWNILVLIGTIL